MQTCTMQMHLSETRKRRETKTKTYKKLTKEKSAVKKGNKPQAPLASEQRFKSMWPLSWLSRRKWKRISMCLVLECRTGFFAMLMADVLSTKMGTLPKLKPKSCKVCFIQSIWEQQLAAAT